MSEEETFYQQSKVHAHRYRVDPNYIQDMKHIINYSSKRSTVCKWLFEIVIVLKLDLQVYFLAVNYFDRYMSKNTYERQDNIQAIAIACLRIAEKYEDVNPHDVATYARVSNTYDKTILVYEIKVLEELGWYLNYITPLRFIEEFTQNMNIQLQLNAKYLAALATCHGYFLKYASIDISAICIYISSRIINNKPVNEETSTLLLQTLYDEDKTIIKGFQDMKKYKFVIEKKLSPIKLREIHKSPPKEIKRPLFPLPHIK